jgi:hypothetical protein
MVIAPFMWAASVTIDGVQFAIAPIVVLISIGLVIVVPTALFRKWYFYRRRLKKRIITAEYEPPLGLNPAELGYMFDGKLGEREIAATIIDLIQRGCLHIKKTEHGTRIFAGPRVENNTKQYENKLIEEASVDDGVTGKDLLGRFIRTTNSSGSVTVSAPKAVVFSQMVHADLEFRGYVKGSLFWESIKGFLKINLLLHICLLYLPALAMLILYTFQTGSFDFGIFAGVFFAAFGLAIATEVPFFIAAVILQHARGRIIGREWIITEKLERLWPQIVGYRQYVKLVENERLEFQTEELAKMSKKETLAYAVALGFVKNWRKIIG